MWKKKKIYRRLPGRKKGIIGIYTLWQGPDHLLTIDSKRFSEDYKRFYFQDIQAIITQKTTTGKVLNSIWALLAGLFGLAAYRSPRGGAITLWSFSGIFLFVLGINLLLGPTCTCRIMTGIQQSRLPSLGHLRTAEKVVGTLRRVIQKTQGKLIDTRVVY